MGRLISPAVLLILGLPYTAIWLGIWYNINSKLYSNLVLEILVFIASGVLAWGILALMILEVCFVMGIVRYVMSDPDPEEQWKNRFKGRKWNPNIYRDEHPHQDPPT